MRPTAVGGAVALVVATAGCASPVEQPTPSAPPAAGQAAITIEPPEMNERPDYKAQVRVGLQDLAAEAGPYLNANRRIVEVILPDACKRCAKGAATDAIVDFKTIVVVAQGGRPVEATPEPVNPFTACVSAALAGAAFTEPPRDRAVVWFEVSFERR